MYRIAICDDDKTICNQLSEIINEFASTNYLDIQPVLFFHCRDLYQELKNKEGLQFDLIFLNIEFKGDTMNGIVIGHWIRYKLKNEVIQIVYMSKKKEFCMSLFELRPLNFRLKPIDSRKIITDLKRAIRIKGIVEEVFRYKSGNTIKFVNLNDILYFESYGHRVKLFLYEDSVKYQDFSHTNLCCRPNSQDFVGMEIRMEIFYEKLSNIYPKISKYAFIWAHNSFLINCKYIKEYGNKQIVMKNGDIIPVSRGRKKELESITVCESIM